MDFEGMTTEQIYELIDAAQTELGRRQICTQRNLTTLS